ncbi:MAG TPA: DNA polymerase IV, partial [Mycobacterium sp.]|nr:DNA polymerase IV [Mycobacterium sp.]
STAPLLAAARRLVADAAPLVAQRGLSLVGFAVSGIDRSGSQQLTLPFADPKHRGDDIDAAIDRVRRRYGKSALTPAVLLGRDPGFEMPHLPD